MLPNVASVRNAGVKSRYDRFRAHSRSGCKSPITVANWKNRPLPGFRRGAKRKDQLPLADMPAARVFAGRA
jgi:hypothetical protein